jgi:prepilin-type N-terminal cleavage/methylation domain-containing protein
MKNRGFTLVEMMVAIAVFSIVMTVALGALINVIDANKKAQMIKTAVNNVNFALESISKDMRMGTDYNCAADINIEPDGDCGAGGEIIKYKSIKEDDNKYVYYRHATTTTSDGRQIGQIQRCVTSSSCGDNDYLSLTSNEVNITNMKFYVIGAEPVGGTRQQPRVIITLTGVAGTVEKIKTTFDLQTSVSQRNRIIDAPLQ